MTLLTRTPVRPVCRLAKLPVWLHIVISTVAFVLVSSPAFSQPEDLILREMDRALDRSLWEVGPFHLTPALRTGIGYDSNAILVAGSRHPDVRALFAPGINAVIPMGQRALIEVYEELDFVYWRDLEEFRDVFNVTQLGGAVGGKSMVARVNGEWREEKVRPTREFDVPVDQSSQRLNADIDFSMGWRHELIFAYERYRVEIRDTDATIRDVPLKSLLDRVEDSYSANLTRHLTSDTALFFEGFFGTQTYDDKAVQRDGVAYGIGGGFSFSPTGNVDGIAQLGLKRIVPDSPFQPGFKGLVADVNVRVGLGSRYSLLGRYFRDTSPSLLNQTLYVLNTVYGASLDIYFGGRFILRPGFRFAQNDYPDFDTLGPAQASTPSRALLIRDVKAVSLSFDYRMTPDWLFRVETIYSHRETFPSSAQEDRFIVNLGLATTF